MAPPYIYCMRHGLTDWNAEGRLQGQTDIPLNDTGRQQARRNGLALRAHFERDNVDPATLDFVCSPLGRARETMEIAREAMGLETKAYRIDKAIAEVAFGIWEGSTYEEIRARDAEAHAARKKNKWGYQPPEGESYAMMSARVQRWYETLDKPAFAVAHGGTSRAIRGFLLGLETREIPIQEAPQDRVFLIRDEELIWI